MFHVLQVEETSDHVLRILGCRYADSGQTDDPGQHCIGPCSIDLERPPCEISCKILVLDPLLHRVRKMSDLGRGVARSLHVCQTFSLRPEHLGAGARGVREPQWTEKGRMRGEHPLYGS
jgi:hypothetical protein